MSTEFNYVVNVDTSRVMGAMSEVRSQVGMALGSATGFQGPAAGLAGAGTGSFSAAAGGAAGGFAQMMSGLGRGPSFSGMPGALGGSTFGGTFTNSAMAYTPHYGAMQAETSLQQEWLVHRYGMQAAQMGKPPGVSASEYAMGVEKNFIDRQLEAKHQASMAARTSFFSSAGGLLGGEAASMVAAPIGAFAGGKLATRFFGSGAAGAGKMIGGLGASMLAFGAGADYVGGQISEHFAEVEQIGGVTRELGDIVGSGRGFGREQRYNLGVAARQAAKDLNMDVQEMGDIMSLGRQSGMLPTASNPEKAREQFRDFARTIEEGAQMLHTSLANATRMIKGMGQMGEGGRSGVLNLIGMSEAAGMSPGAMYGIGMAGAGMAQSNLLSRSQGFNLFTGGVMAASGAGLSREEMGMLGGRAAAGQMIGSTQMAAALSPMGDMQLMAAASGQPLGDMMSMPGQAIGAMSQGGDLIGNMIKFQTHKRELLRGTGSEGIRTMAREQLGGVADVLMGASPSLDENTAKLFAARQMYGLNEVQAKAYVGGLRGGGGGGGGGAIGRAAQAEALMGTMVSQNAGGPPGETDASMFGGDSLRYTKMGAAGFLSGNLMVGLGTTAAGAAVDIGRKVSDLDLFGGPGLFSSAQEKADYYQKEKAREFEARKTEAQHRMGIVDFDKGIAARAMSADLSGARLDFDAVGSAKASTISRGQMLSSGFDPVAAGPGTIKVGGDYFSIEDYQKAARMPMIAKGATGQGERDAIEAAHQAGFTVSGQRSVAGEVVRDSGGPLAFFSQGDREMLAEGMSSSKAASLAKNEAEVLRNAYYQVATGKPAEGDGVVNAGERLLPTVKRFARGIEDEDLRGKIMSRLNKPGGINDAVVRRFISGVTGDDNIPDMMIGARAAMALGGAGEQAIEASRQREVAWLQSAYGGEVSARALSDSQLREEYEEYTAKQMRSRSSAPTMVGGMAISSPGSSSTHVKSFEQFARERRSEIDADPMLGKYYSRLVENEMYAKGKEAAARGNLEEAQALIRGAQHQVQVEGKFWGITPGDIDVDREVLGPGGGAARAITNTVETTAKLSRVIGGGSNKLSSTLEKAADGILDAFATTFGQEADEEADTTGKLKKKRRRRAGTMQRAIGFGEQESAMASINKSLKQTNDAIRRTHGMVKELEKKVSGGNANPNEGAT